MILVVEITQSDLIFGIGITENCFLCQATEIGKSVNGIRKHGDKEIRHLARTLIEYENFAFG